eukprot:1776948-Rhodomonas_salina.1
MNTLESVPPLRTSAVFTTTSYSAGACAAPYSPIQYPPSPIQYPSRPIQCPLCAQISTMAEA